MHGDSSVAQRRTLLDNCKYEFPVVPQSLVGRKTRYIYAIQLDMMTGLEQAKAVIKVDTCTGEMQSHVFEDDGCCAECAFVPRRIQSGGVMDEDEGYLVTFTYHAHRDSSSFYVLDAKTMSPSGPVAVVPLPRRVPFGFHSLWVPRSEMNSQRVLKK